MKLSIRLKLPPYIVGPRKHLNDTHMNCLQHRSSRLVCAGVVILLCSVFFIGVTAGTETAVQDSDQITVTDDPTTATEVADIASGLEQVADGGEIHIDSSYDPAVEPTYPIIIDQSVTITTDADDPASITPSSDAAAVFDIIHSDVEISSVEITQTGRDSGSVTSLSVAASAVTLSDLTITGDAMNSDDIAIAVSDTESVTDVELVNTVIDGTYSTGIAAQTAVSKLNVQNNQFHHQGEDAIVIDPDTDVAGGVTVSDNDIGADLSVGISHVRLEDGELSVRDNEFAADTCLAISIDSETDELSSAVITDNAFASSTHVGIDAPDRSHGQITLAPNWWGDQYGPDITALSELTNPQHALSPNRSAASVSANHPASIEITPWYADQSLTTETAPVENDDRTYLRIQEAIDEASTDDRIDVHEGKFRSSVTIDSPIILSGNSNQSQIHGTVSVEPSQDVSTSSSGELKDIQIRDFQFQNFDRKNDPLISIETSETGVHVSNSTFRAYWTPLVTIEADNSNVHFGRNSLFLDTPETDPDIDRAAIEITHNNDIHLSSNKIISLDEAQVANGASISGLGRTYIQNNVIKGFHTGIYTDTISIVAENVLKHNYKAIHVDSTASIQNNLFSYSCEAAIFATHDRSLSFDGNWWNSTNGPSGVGEGDGDPIVNKSDSGINIGDFATITDSGSLSAEVDLLGMEHDPVANLDQAVHFTGEDIMYDPRDTGEPHPASGTIVIEIAGAEFTGELDSGSVSDLTIDDPTASFESTETDSGKVDITIPNTNLGSVGSITLLHEVYHPTESGYAPISIPQPSELYIEQESPHIVTWNETVEEYQPIDVPINTGDLLTDEYLNNGFYFHFSDADVRYGFAYVTKSDDLGSSTTASLEEGWNLISTNYDTSSSDTICVEQDLLVADIPTSDAGYKDENIVVYAASSADRLYADSIVSSHSLYWINVKDGTTTEDRPIQTPVYDPNPGG